MQFSWSNANLRMGAAHPWSDFSGCGCTRRTRSNVIPDQDLITCLTISYPRSGAKVPLALLQCVINSTNLGQRTKFSIGAATTQEWSLMARAR